MIPVYVCNIKRQHASLQPYFKILFVFALSCQCVRADLLPWCMHNLVWMKAAWRRRPLMHKRCVCVRACACLCVCLFKVWAGCSWCIILDDYYVGWIETTKPVKQGAFVVMMTQKNAPDSLFMQNVSHLQKKINFLEHINQRGDVTMTLCQVHDKYCCTETGQAQRLPSFPACLGPFPWQTSPVFHVLRFVILFTTVKALQNDHGSDLVSPWKTSRRATGALLIWPF